ncbi:hypothetical protein CsSME_00038586 [Camellia sinensis var. sinensis]
MLLAHLLFPLNPWTRHPFFLSRIVGIQNLYVHLLGYVNDGRPFWQYIVSSSTGCSDSQYFEELYNYYTTEKFACSKYVFICFYPKAWHLCDPDAEKDAAHVGDDHRNDIWGARDTGCDAWL